jgi:HTH-type transcriptional regulator, sugar sensing transcriptional regulator
MSNVKGGLKLIGLTDLEADVYLKLLKLKEAKISQISKETNVTRTQLYPLLEKLVGKGFVEKTGNNIAIYRAIDSDEIISLLNKWKEKQLKLLKELELEFKKLKN